MRLCTLVSTLVVALATTAVFAQDASVDLEKVLSNPPATGMLITGVVPGSQAAERGMRSGDVMVSYDGVATPTMEVLRQAVGAALEKETIEAVLVRGGERVTVTLRPGQMGINLLAVVKGESVATLPPATDVRFDFEAIRGKTREEWYAFSLAGGEHVGFEHAVLRVEDGRLLLDREVSFDGGEQWGLNRMIVRIVATAEAVPQTLSARIRSPLEDSVCQGDLRRGLDGRAVWHARIVDKGAVTEQDAEAPERLIASWLVEILASFMPREAGACFHFRMAEEGSGRVGEAAALLVVGKETVETADGPVEAWKMEQRGLGNQVTGRFFVTDDGRVVVADYMGAMGRLTTRAKALEGVPEELSPMPLD